MENKTLKDEIAMICMEALLRKEYRDLAYTANRAGKSSMAEFVIDEAYNMAELAMKRREIVKEDNNPE